MSVISTALSSRSGATTTAAACATSAVASVVDWLASPMIPAWPARRASSTASARPSITTIESGATPWARSVSMAARPFTPYPQTIVWSCKVLLQSFSR